MKRFVIIKCNYFDFDVIFSGLAEPLVCCFYMLVQANKTIQKTKPILVLHGVCGPLSSYTWRNMDSTHSQIAEQQNCSCVYREEATSTCFTCLTLPREKAQCLESTSIVLIARFSWIQRIQVCKDWQRWLFHRCSIRLFYKVVAALQLCNLVFSLLSKRSPE